MTLIAGIRIRKAQPLCYVDAGDTPLPRLAYAVVQTAKGRELGQVVRAAAPLVWQPEKGEPPARLVRRAGAADLAQWEENIGLAEQALRQARARARELRLPMKLVDAYYNLDRSRVTLTYGADGRVDFRPLLQALGADLRCRVELRQVGDRDVAKLAGGVGRCGRSLCCSTWMTRFEAVSIRMAKEQALPISAEGLAGACGRLRCCLRYEYEQYRQLNQAMPRIGEEVRTQRGLARVIVGHKLRETVSVRYADDAVLELPLAEVERLAQSQN